MKQSVRVATAIAWAAVCCGCSQPAPAGSPNSQADRDYVPSDPWSIHASDAGDLLGISSFSLEWGCGSVEQVHIGVWTLSSGTSLMLGLHMTLNELRALVDGALLATSDSTRPEGPIDLGGVVNTQIDGVYVSRQIDSVRFRFVSGSHWALDVTASQPFVSLADGTYSNDAGDLPQTTSVHAEGPVFVVCSVPASWLDYPVDAGTASSDTDGSCNGPGLVWDQGFTTSFCRNALDASGLAAFQAANPGP